MPSHSLDDRKEQLIHRLKARGYLRSEAVERAMRLVPREEFILPGSKGSAYVDSPLSISYGQTISAPHMCVIMCEALELDEGMKVLEVGGGSGYHAALCAEIVAPRGSTNPGHVFTTEIVKGLTEFAKGNLERTGYSDRVTVIHVDGGMGLSEEAPFDRILVAAAAPVIPPPLIEQLLPSGILLIPVGSRGFFQELVMVNKKADGEITTKRYGGVAFVPLTGEYGYRSY